MRRPGILDTTIEVAVAFHDVDVAAVVWHGHYLKYLENARWALMERMRFGLEEMLACGYGWPIVEVHVKYVRAARFGDRLAVRAWLAEWQNRLAVNYLITHAASGERVARARTVQVAVEARSGALQFVSPPILLERVQAATARQAAKVGT